MDGITELKLRLPPIYKRNGRDCYLDPIRKKLIFITPEETIRQKVISYLIDYLKVPANNITVEQHLSHYRQGATKRADIIIHKRDSENLLHPIAVIECKADNVNLDDKAREQMLEYCDLIEADYAMLINGDRQFCFKYDYDVGNYRAIEGLPEYDKMLEGQYEEYDPGEFPQRIEFDNIKTFLEEDFATFEEGFYGIDISSKTPIDLAVATFNLSDGLMDPRVRMPAGDYGLFRLIEDYGVRIVTYGNGSGGKFCGPYRSFLVNVNGSTEFYSIGVSTYFTSAKPDDVKTCISVAHDNEESAHHALQLVVDDNLVMNGQTVEFYHHGRIAVGRMGSGKIDELRQFVKKRYPKIIKGDKFYLGKLENDRLWRLDDPEVIEVIVNLISYAMVRDEYRKFVKEVRIGSKNKLGNRR